MQVIARSLQLALIIGLTLAFETTGAASAPREGAGAWQLQKGAGLPSRKARKPTLSMQGEKLSGSTGCNTFTATLVRHADKRVTIDGIALTRMLVRAGTEHHRERICERAAANPVRDRAGSVDDLPVRGKQTPARLDQTARVRLAQHPQRPVGPRRYRQQSNANRTRWCTRCAVRSSGRDPRERMP